jgi:N-acyl-D-amino-acid deacylase
MTQTVILRGGSIADGSGQPLFEADVAIADGRIVAIGEGLSGDVELSAHGAVVAPGFIDIHTHYDAQVLWDPTASPSCWQGVTTVVLGNCGFGVAPCRPENRPLIIKLLVDLEDMPRDALEAGIDWSFATFAEYLAALERVNTLINVAAYVPHSPMRFEVMGQEAYQRAATEPEIALITAMLAEAMEAGAAGFSTSSSPTGRPCPTRLVEERELVAMMRELKKSGRGVAAFVPGGPALSARRLYELQEEIGCTVTYTALMTSADGKHRERVALHDEFRERGSDVHPQVSCRPLIAQVTMRTAFALRTPTHLAMEGVSDAERLAAYRDPAWRAVLADELTRAYQPPRWNLWTIVTSPTQPNFEGGNVATLAAASSKTPLDWVLDLVVQDELDTRIELVISNDDEPEVARLLNLEGAVIGLSDAGAHPDQICDAIQPLDLLGKWVREKGVMSLEAAVRKLSAEQAEMFGFDCGRIAVGAPADIVVFEPDVIGPGPRRRVTDLPAGAPRIIADQPTGLRHVLVSGVPIRRDHQSLDIRGRRPGRLLRPGAARH